MFTLPKMYTCLLNGTFGVFPGIADLICIFREPSYPESGMTSKGGFIEVSDKRMYLAWAHEKNKSTSWLSVKYFNGPDNRQGDNTIE